MRILLAIWIVAGLILNSGAAFASAIPMAHAHAAPAAQHKMHSHAEASEDCHKPPAKSHTEPCKCCAGKAKCNHESCLCLKCFGAFADVWPVHHAVLAFTAVLAPGVSGKPPIAVRQPPPPPPQA